MARNVVIGLAVGVVVAVAVVNQKQGVASESDWFSIFSLAPSCTGLDASSCDADERCMSIEAWNNGDDGCVDRDTPMRFVECKAAGPCTAAIRWAESPTGECLRFSSGCTPQGWMSCEGCESVPSRVEGSRR